MEQVTKEWNSIKSSKEELSKNMETYIEPYKPPSMVSFFKKSQILNPCNSRYQQARMHMKILKLLKLTFLTALMYQIKKTF